MRKAITRLGELLKAWFVYVRVWQCVRLKRGCNEDFVGMAREGPEEPQLPEREEEILVCGCVAAA